MNQFEKIVSIALVICSMLGIILILILLVYYDVFKISQLSADWALAIASILATGVLAVITALQMLEARKLRIESVRPSLSLEPANFEYGNFRTLLLANSSNIARDVEIDVNHLGKTNLGYISSIASGQRVPILGGTFPKDGGIATAVVRYRDLNGTRHVENLSINFSSIISANRKCANILSSDDVLSTTIYNSANPLREIERSLKEIAHRLEQEK